MKIAIIRKKHTFHGGAEAFSQKLITGLASAGHEVHIYAIEWRGVPPCKNIYFHKVPAITFNSTLRDLSFAVSAYMVLRREKFDIIQSHDKTLYQDIYRAGDGCHIEWLRQRWKRTGLTEKLSIIFNPYHLLILTLERIIFKFHRYRKIIAISEMVKRNIIENYGVPPAKIEMIYNGVDIEKFCPENRKKYSSEVRQKYGLTDADFVLLFVGSGFERKGLKCLINAVEVLTVPVSLLVVGRGSEHEFRNRAGRQKIIFCGPQKDIQKYYAASDIFVLPAIYEPFGNVYLEALASGLPIITTTLSGASEIIDDDKDGFVIPNPENIEMIADRINKLMDENKRKKMSENAREKAEEFSIEKHITKTMGLYEEIIASKKHFKKLMDS